MKRFALILITVILCVCCFGCAPAKEQSEVLTDSSAQGSGTAESGALESHGDPAKSPVTYFLITVSGVIGIAAVAVLIRDAKRKPKNN